MNDRDITVLKRIVQYADEIDGTLSRFSLEFDKFKADYVVKNAISMCVLQIGELVGKLSGELKAEYNKMPWRDIVSIRNRAAHAYGSIDVEILWDIAVNNVPELRAYCVAIISAID